MPSAASAGRSSCVDQNGKPVTDQDLKGQPFLVFFGFTHCPDVCPTTLFEVSEIFRALGPDAERVSALFITVDPERDTPAVLKDYLSSFDPHSRAHRRCRRRSPRSRRPIASMPRRFRSTAATTPWTTPRSSI